VPEFLVETYVHDAEQARRAAASATGLGAARLLHAILVPGEELCLALWTGPDAEAVGAAAAEAGLPHDRIVAAEDVLL
jgi:hypothetical protein